MQKYIIIEGIHGSGKTTVAKALASFLQEKGYNAQYYHFPDEEDMLGKVIRQVVADKQVVHHWQVTGALYAAFANRFHLKTQDDDVIYVTDRHSVTTGLVFQQQIPDLVRRELYGIGIEALQTQGIGFYISVEKEVARERLQPRNDELRQEDGVWKDKANDKFVEEKFDELTAMYDNYLVGSVKKLGIEIYQVSNNSSIEECVKQIIAYLITQE